MLAKQNMQIFQQIFIGIIIAVVTSWITVVLAMRRFRAEWLWKRKADTYSSIIEALHNSKALNFIRLRSKKEKGSGYFLTFFDNQKKRGHSGF